MINKELHNSCTDGARIMHLQFRKIRKFLQDIRVLNIELWPSLSVFPPPTIISFRRAAFLTTARDTCL